VSPRINRRGKDQRQSDSSTIEFARQENYQVPVEWIFEDEGLSGASLIKSGSERIRDLAAEGQIQTVLALLPDRLRHKYAYQVLLAEELARNGVDPVFIKALHSGTPEDQLLLQFQGMIDSLNTSEHKFCIAHGVASGIGLRSEGTGGG